MFDSYKTSHVEVGFGDTASMTNISFCVRGSGELDG